MDRAMEVNDEDMLLRTLSYFELCRELSADPAVTATPSYRLEANHVNADNEIHSSFFSTQSQQNNIFRQPCSLIGEANSFQEFNTKGTYVILDGFRDCTYRVNIYIYTTS